jgi:hypothetical protein
MPVSVRARTVRSPPVGGDVKEATDDARDRGA